MKLNPLLLLYYFLPYINYTTAATTTTEAHALLSLKTSCHDPCNTLATWNAHSLSSVCSWKGVSCQLPPRNYSHVVAISIPGLLQGGSLPSSISKLPHLRVLNLSNNSLVGSIPPEIGQLTNLVMLDLSDNSFTGIIPVEVSNLLNLRRLRLFSNSLNGTISANLGNLKSLVELDLGFNRLQGPIPPQLGNLSSVKRLILRHNSLSEAIPEDLSYATALRYLMLESNNLSGEIPPQIGRLSHLLYLGVEHNALSGSIPGHMGNLSELLGLYAGYNKISGVIPDHIGNLSKLRIFELQGNLLVGEITPSLGSLKNVATIDLANNSLNGTIPSALASLFSLQNLYLNNNNLSGNIPSALSRFPASSFSGNIALCGAPVTNACTYSFPSPPISSYYSNGWKPLPSLPKRRQRKTSNSRKTKIIVGIVVGVVGFGLFFSVLIFLLSRKNGHPIRNWFTPEYQAKREEGRFEMFAGHFTHSYDEIVANAGYYDTAHILGRGRFATVYLSTFPVGIQLAVKVFKYSNVSPGFEKEIELLRGIKHRHLLPIRGVYVNKVEKAILYEFMPRGCLYNLLHHHSGTSGTLPDWATRLRIAVGTAQALSYLHRGFNSQIIHKDVKSSNILLDGNMTPRLADFGLAGLVSSQPDKDAGSYIITPGYTAPEVKHSKRYTEKSDVYSFGVVLLELVTGKKPVSTIGDRSLFLVTWAIRLHKERRGKEVLDQRAKETCPFLNHLDRALNLAILCLDDNPAHRPTMSEVAAILESLNANPSPLRSPDVRAEKPLLS